MTLTIYVPKDDSHRLSIQSGSAMVGRPAKLGGHVELCYEGDIYGHLSEDAEREGIEPFFWWLYHAADRLVTNYPTITRVWYPEDELVAVGFYDHDTRQAAIMDEEALAAWRDA